VKAVYIKEFGGPENLEVREVPQPLTPTGTQVLIRVKAAGLNRADIMQRLGKYPPPAGFSPNIPGLEFAGEVGDIGEAVTRFKNEDRVFGITAGEAQAEYLVTDESLLARIPENLTFTEAAAVPEVFITAHDAVFTQCELKAGEWLLVHAVGSGVGLAALQLAKANGARVAGTSRTQDKLDRCREFGLDLPILSREPKFAGQVIDATSGNGANVVLDLVGGPNFAENLAAVAVKGRIILVGLTAGRSAEFDMGTALFKRVKIIGTVLRARTTEEKADATIRFIEEVVPFLASGKVRPNLDRVFPASEIADAHRYLESNESFGKVVLEF
jgi:putative PIG3 family NAD(P)H quinone oxidoreductase